MSPSPFDVAEPEVVTAIYKVATQAKATGKPAHVELVVARRTIKVSVAPAKPDEPAWVLGVRWHIRLRVDAEQVLKLNVTDARGLDLWIGEQECGLNVLCVAAPPRVPPFPGMALRYNVKNAGDPWVGHIVTDGRFRDSFWYVIDPPKKEPVNG